MTVPIQCTPDETFVTKWGSSGTGDGQFVTLFGVAVDLGSCTQSLITTRSLVEDPRKSDFVSAVAVKPNRRGPGEPGPLPRVGGTDTPPTAVKQRRSGQRATRTDRTTQPTARHGTTHIAQAATLKVRPMANEIRQSALAHPLSGRGLDSTPGLGWISAPTVTSPAGDVSGCPFRLEG